MPQPDFATPEEDLELLRTSAVTAGIIAASYFRRDLKSWTKAAGSPVSEADIVIDKYLRSTLVTARPDYGWLSEESPDDAVRLERRRCFIVDPIDGTSGFLRGDDSWTVSLAVVEDGAAIAGVVYAPARDEMYYACRGGGAWRSGARLHRQRPLDRHLPLIPAPGAVHQELQASGLDYTRGPAFASLAYRLVQVATGGIDAAVVRRGAQDWDVAGAAVILSEAQVFFEDVCAGSIRFNQREVRHGALAALCEPSLKPVLHAALIKVYGCPQPQQADLERQSK